jgi:hypothetical protein
MCRINIADIICTKFCDLKPIRLMPILNLQCDVDKLQKERDRALGEDVMYYLINIMININNKCIQNAAVLI